MALECAMKRISRRKTKKLLQRELLRALRCYGLDIPFALWDKPGVLAILLERATGSGATKNRALFLRRVLQRYKKGR